jgi:hypothetical protein
MRRPYRAAAAVGLLLALAACNSGIDPSGLEPLTSEQARSIAPPPPGIALDAPASVAAQAPAAVPPPAQPSSMPAAPAAPAAAPQIAAIPASARIQFAPVVGADPGKVAPLAARLSARAAQRGIGVAAAGDGAVTHILKGYFSAFTDKGETTVIYVWDVLDAAGNRLHRIQGQQKVTGGQGEGWNAVNAATMEAIADRTIDDLAVWLSSATG